MGMHMDGAEKGKDITQPACARGYRESQNLPCTIHLLDLPLIHVPNERGRNYVLQESS